MVKSEDNGVAFRDKLLEAKLDHIAGVVGFLFPNGHFSNKALATLLGVAQPQMTRKRSGQALIDNQDLSRLLVYCGLDGLTVDDLRTDSIDALDAALKRQAIGIHGPRDGDAVRRKWLGDANHRPGKIGIERVSTRRAGLGAPAGSDGTIPSLRIGETVRIVFTVPTDGQILVLNDEYLRCEMTCLVPSCFAPTTSVKGGSVVIPFKGPAIEPLLTVLGGPGWCRIFVVWTPHELPLRGLPDRVAEQAPFAVSAPMLHAADGAIDRLRQAGRPYSILTGDYRVIE